MSPRDGRAASQNGFALLIVLWCMVLLSLIATTIVATGRSEVQRSANMLAAAGVQTAADAAVQMVAFRLLDRAPGWSADGTPHVIDMASGIRVEVRVTSEQSKVNPNLASPGLLAALFQEVGADPFVANSIANNILLWRVPWLRPGVSNPAEKAYAAAGLGYGPPGIPFRNLNEVGAVLGMTPQLLARARPYLSLYAPAEPDPQYASRPVLVALGAGSEMPGLARAKSMGLVVSIRASVPGANGAHFIREAIVQLSSEQGTDPVRVLTWDRHDDG